MLGIILIVFAILIFLLLYLYIRNTESTDGENVDLEFLKNNDTTLVDEENNDTTEKSLEDEEEYEEYTYDSYKTDEEYLRMAKLAKYIYYSIVGVVIFILAMLYIMLFK